MLVQNKIALSIIVALSLISISYIVGYKNGTQTQFIKTLASPIPAKEIKVKGTLEWATKLGSFDTDPYKLFIVTSNLNDTSPSDSNQAYEFAYLVDTYPYPSRSKEVARFPVPGYTALGSELISVRAKYHLFFTGESYMVFSNDGNIITTSLSESNSDLIDATYTIQNKYYESTQIPIEYELRGGQEKSALLDVTTGKLVPGSIKNKK